MQEMMVFRQTGNNKKLLFLCYELILNTLTSVLGPKQEITHKQETGNYPAGDKNPISKNKKRIGSKSEVVYLVNL
ncbi:MAG: hypothetical protein JSS82_11505 [Bacteroidetes bacterium]|nr:hypothetical protein [Bacteroidota bacterium]